MSTTTEPPPAPTGPPGRRRSDRPRRPRWPVVVLVVAALVLSGALLGLPSRALSALQPGHAFLAEDGGRPVTWDNCRAIHLVVNPQGAPRDWESVLDAARAEINAASGYVLVVDGTTRDHDFLAGRRPGDPVLVGWGVRREIGRLGEGAAGYGGPITFPTDHGPQHGSGIVLLDSLYLDQLDREGRTDEIQMIVEHELMHVLGLAHVDRDDQVMGVSGRRTGGTHLGGGDVDGLRALRAVPCPPS